MSESVDEFALFYRSYPRHKAVEDARKAWRQTAASRPPLQDLLLALDRQKREWAGKDPQYLPYPATWLRAHRWEDEDDPQPSSQAWDSYAWANRARTPEEERAEREEVERLEQQFKREEEERKRR